MVKILAVNNYPARERSDRLVECLRESGADVTTMEWGDASVPRFGGFDAAVLSGSPSMWTDETTAAKYSGEVQAVSDSQIPALGICFGHQLVARAFGAEVVRDSREVKEMVRTSVLVDDPLFAGLPRSLVLRESRLEVVKSLPAGFGLLAKSDTSAIAAMKHPRRLLYGVQFHPEEYSEDHPDGKSVLGNFLGLVR